MRNSAVRNIELNITFMCIPITFFFKRIVA